MDENYLDNLLNEISLDKEINHKIEDELDDQIRDEKQKKRQEQELSKEQVFDLDLEQDNLKMDDPLDLHFSEDQMNELDELDHLADLDIGDLDFSDIDFDDVDVTKLDELDDTDFDALLKDFEGDLQVDPFFKKESEFGKAEDKGKQQIDGQTKEMEETDSGTEEQIPLQMEQAVEEEQTDAEEVTAQDELNADAFDANDFVDSLLEEEEAQKQEADLEEIPEIPESGKTNEDETAQEELPDLEDLLNLDEAIEGESPIEGHEEEVQTESAGEPLQESGEQSDEADPDVSSEQNDIDDLLSLLDEEEETDTGEASGQELSAQDLLSELDQVVDNDPDEEPQPKKKRSFLQILFGDPDDEEDELSPEELEAIESAKAAKKAAKAAKKAAKKQEAENTKAQKALDKEKKKKAENEKNKLKAEKKARKKAQEAELAKNAEPEKKLNKPMVIFVFTLFLGGLFVFYTGTNQFNYKQAIERAANYFEHQKYRKAYNEISGVDVKEKDQQLKDRIYTVMYVERLYESYNNNVTMGYEEKALDSLLRGVSKYYEHYEEAEKLGVVSDLDYSFAQITQVLQSRYGITVEQALAINELGNLEYVQTIEEYVNNTKTEEVTQ